MADAERLVQGRRVDRQNLIRQNHHSVLFGGKDVRVVTIGYQMEGWEPDWAERVLDLTVFKYEMKILDNDPEEWRSGYKEDRMKQQPLLLQTIFLLCSNETKNRNRP